MLRTGICNKMITSTHKKTTFKAIVATSTTISNYVVEADSLNAFKNRLDKYWTNQDVVYDYKSDLTGTGGLPVCA